MARDSATTAAKFESMDEQKRGDLKFNAWAEAVEEFAEEYPDLNALLDKHDAWDDMELEIWEDENGRKYFKKITGVQYHQSHTNGKRLSEAAHEYLGQYRSRLSELVESGGTEADR